MFSRFTENHTDWLSPKNHFPHLTHELWQAQLEGNTTTSTGLEVVVFCLRNCQIEISALLMLQKSGINSPVNWLQ